MRVLRFVVLALKYYTRFYRLTIHAGLVWGIVPGWNESPKEWATRVRSTPLWPEVDSLERTRVELTGTGWE